MKLARLLARPALLPMALLALPVAAQEPARHPTAAESWTPDNGNGTFTNPLFNDEFSDPDIIRVGDDFYMTGTTMHAMPGLPVLHSKDLVNWTHRSYAFDRLDLGPGFRLEDGQDIYGQGIWAPCIRYHDGMFYIFANINRVGMQVFRSPSPDGPWARNPLDAELHDISVLFDDDGRIWAVYNYNEVRLVELTKDLTGVVPGSERVIMPAGNALGEGHHFYKVDGKYMIITANYAPVGRMMALRADSLGGPWETVQISARETMGERTGWGMSTFGLGQRLPTFEDEIGLSPPGNPDRFGASPLHQGGIVDLPNGDWWGFSMMDVRAMGRTVYLSPVTWKDGWPFFGLPGNLGRSPRTWLKPDTGHDQPPRPTWQRDEDFDGAKLNPVWQWNHHPVEAAWRLTGGKLEIDTMPASDFLRAHNTLTQRVIAPESSAAITVDGSGLQAGDRAGIALLNLPFGALGLERTSGGTGWQLTYADQQRNTHVRQPVSGPVVRLRTHFSNDTELGRFEYSEDGGNSWKAIGEELRTPYQLKTFQGVRFALFAYNTQGVKGGTARFDDFDVTEPLADRSKAIPDGQVVTFTNLADDSLVWANPHGMLHKTAPGSEQAAGNAVRFRVHDRGHGRVAIESLGPRGGFVTVVGEGMSADVRFLPESEASLFQWQDMLRGEFMLLSLKTNRYVGIDPLTGEPYGADWPGASPSRKHGVVMRWDPAPAE